MPALPIDGADPCECCGKVPVNARQGGERFGVFTPAEDFYILGPGFVAWLKLMEYIILMLFVSAIFASISLIMMRIRDKSEELDDPSILAPYTLGAYGTWNSTSPNTDFDLVHVEQPLIHSCSYFCQGVIIYFFWHWLKKLILQLTTMTPSPQTYTVMLEGLPEHTTEQELTSWLRERCFLDKELAGLLSLISIIPTYQIGAFRHPIARKEELEAELNLVKRYQEKHPGQLPRKYWFIPFWKHKSTAEIEQELEAVDQIYEKLWEKFDPTRNGYRAFLTFRSQSDTRKLSKDSSFLSHIFCCLSNYENGYDFKGNTIRFYKAPSPDDVSWYSSGSSNFTKLQVNGHVSLAEFILLIIAFGTITTVSVYKQSNFDKFGGTLVAIVLVGVQNLSFYLYNWLLQREFHITKAVHDNVIMWKKLLFVTVFNLYGPLIVYRDSLKWYSADNLAETIFIAACLQGLLANLRMMLEGFQIWEKVKRCFQDRVRVGLNQHEINMQYEGPEPDLSKMMESQIMLMLLPTIYMSIVPLLAYVAFISARISYLLFRPMIVRCYRMPRFSYRARFQSPEFLFIGMVSLDCYAFLYFFVPTQNALIFPIVYACVTIFIVNIIMKSVTIRTTDDFMLNADLFLVPVFLIQPYEVANPFTVTEDLQPFRSLLALLGTEADGATDIISLGEHLGEAYRNRDMISAVDARVALARNEIHIRTLERLIYIKELRYEKTKARLKSALDNYLARQKNRDDICATELANYVRMAAIHEAKETGEMPLVVLCRMRNSLSPQWREKIKGKFLVNSNDEELLARMKNKWQSEIGNHTSINFF